MTAEGGLQLLDLSKRYSGTPSHGAPTGFAGVEGASLAVAPGEIVCLFGASGCGKTTLLRLAAGLETPDAGEVRLGGRILSARGVMTPPERRPIGFVFQDYVLFPHMSVAENVGFGLVHLPARERRARIDAELAAVDLEAYGGRRPHELSGGQQQRVAVARALARRPQAMLLDEPFASIDVALRRRLRAQLRRVLKAAGASSVLVTHDPDEALEIGDRIALMAAGRIVEDASPEALFAAPATAIGAAIFPGAQEIRGTAAPGVRTAFGPIHDARMRQAPSQGDRLRVVLRRGAAEAHLAPSPGQPAFPAVDCRFAGPGWRVTIASPDGAETLILEAPAPVEPGARVGVRFDAAGAFAFPA